MADDSFLEKMARKFGKRAKIEASEGFQTTNMGDTLERQEYKKDMQGLISEHPELKNIAGKQGFGDAVEKLAAEGDEKAQEFVRLYYSWAQNDIDNSVPPDGDVCTCSISRTSGDPPSPWCTAKIHH